MEDLKGLLDKNLGIIKELIEIKVDDGLPNQLYMYAAIRESLTCYESLEKIESYSYGYGYKFNKEAAKKAAIGEAIERYSSAKFPSNLLYFSHNDLKKMKVPFISINEFNHSKKGEKYYKEISSISKLHWTEAKKLSTGDDIYIPASLLYMPFFNKDEIVREEISTGLACGDTFEMALYNGVCELIERDSFGIGWYSNKAFNSIDILSECNQENLSIINYLKEYEIEVLLKDITSDLNIPTYSLTLINNGNHFNIPKRYISIKTGYNFNKVLKNLLGEALGGYISLAKLYSTGKKVPNKDKDIYNLEDNALYYGKNPSLNELRLIDLVHKKNIKATNKYPTISSYKEGIDNICKKLIKNGIEVYFKDLTTEDIKKKGLHVVKVVSNTLYYLSNDSTGENNKRLIKALNKGKINTKIHPFS